jgi:hypothetical protein
MVIFKSLKVGIEMHGTFAQGPPLICGDVRHD